MRKVATLLLLALPFAGQAQPSPYAGQQERPIKSLSAAETAGLLAGEGMGLAKAAELNGYPGPSHVLELAAPLRLTPRQQEDTRRLMAEHKAAARRIGAEIVQRERDLDALFAGRSANEAEVARLTAEIGALQARLRAEHLQTHLRQTALLDAAQVAQYAKERGYAADGPQHGHRRPESGGTHGHGTGSAPAR